MTIDSNDTRRFADRSRQQTPAYAGREGEQSAMDKPDIAAPRQRRSNLRTTLTWLLRAAISFGLIFYILWGTEVGEVLAAIRVADLRLILLALGLQILGALIMAMRFGILLAVRDPRPGLAYLFVSTMSAAFFRQFLPSTLGGDALRGYDAWRAGASKGFAVLALFVDRLLGLAVMTAFAVLAIALFGSDRGNMSGAYRWAIVGLILVMIALGLLFYLPARQKGQLSALASRLPARVSTIAEKLGQIATTFHGKGGVLAKSAALTLVLQVNVVLFYWVVAQSLGLEVQFWAFFVIVPVTVLVMMAPITINGIGLREAILVYLWGIWGVSSELALALAWLEFGITLTLGLIGGVIFALRPSRSEILSSTQS